MRAGPIALGPPLPPLSPPRDRGAGAKNLAAPRNARDAPVTPFNVEPVIDRSKVDPETLKAAEGMESMFINYMMKVMRETVPKNDLDMESPATNIYRSMLDEETAERAVRAGGIGLADQIIAYLQSQGYTQNQAVSTGGTHADQSDRK